MADRRRKRGSTKHRGIYLKARPLPSGATAWRARYRDPDTGTTKYETLPAHLTTEELRAGWAAAKARELADRERDLEKGAARKTGLPIADALELYFTENGARLRAKTVRSYRLATDALIAFAKVRRIERADDLRAEHLEAFRGWMFNLPKQAQAKGKGRGRGAREVADRGRSVVSVNSRLRALKTVLDTLRRLGAVPMLTGDAIKDRLRAERQPRPVPEHLLPTDIAKLIRAALRHDAERLSLTRDEKARGLRPGEGATPKYDPIAPYLVTVLLTGMREDEARSLQWDRVNLDAPPAGVITLRPEDTKTKIGRQVDFAVSPLLRQMLRALKVRAGGAALVFGALSRGKVEAARKRMMRDYGAPTFTWQMLRSTCGTYLANSNIWGGASAWREARQLGHSVLVAERHYLNVVLDVPRDATTLEAVMRVEAEVRMALRAAGGERVDAEALTA